MRTTFITGGAGFIGSNFVRLVIDKTDHHIVIIDNLTYSGSSTTLEDVSSNPRVTFVRCDIGDKSTIANLLETHRPSALVNFAAETHVDRSIDDPWPFIQSNIVGTFSLLESSRSYIGRLSPTEKEIFRFLQVSTDEVYGSLGESGSFSESHSYAPNSPYSASKAGADHLVRAYQETYGLQTVITNCSNNFGPFQFPEKLIPLMILNATEGKPLPIYGDGKNIRDWLHVRDHCTGILLALLKGRNGERYNIGAGNERSNYDIVLSICSILDRLMPATENPKMEKTGATAYKDLITFVQDRPGHDRRYAIDAKKIRRELGWEPEYTFEQGLTQTVEWYINNIAWCKSVTEGNYQQTRLGLGDLS